MPGLFDSRGGPDFSVLGMVLGGQGYAANWFAQRDAMQREEMLRQQKQQERGQFAQQLVTSPQFETYLKDPSSREAAYKLWALGQAGPEAIANSQASYLAQTLSDVGNRENAAYSSGLQAANIRLSHDEELRVDAVKRQRDAAAQERAYQVLEQVRQGGANEVTKNIAFDAAVKDTGFKRPDNMSVDFDQNGQPYFLPSTGSEKHGELMGKVNASMGIVDNMSMAVQGLESNTMTPDDWKAIRFDTLNHIRAAEKTGTLDQGTMDAFSMAFPEYSHTGLYDAKTIDGMKTYIELQKARIPQIASQYAIPLEKIPRAENYKPKEIKRFDPSDPKYNKTTKPAAGKFTPAPTYDPYSSAPLNVPEARPQQGPPIPPELFLKLGRQTGLY